jgi:hypothetical protein
MNTYLDPQPTSLPALAIPVAHPPDSTDRSARYRAILQRRIDDGAKRAAEILAAIQRDQPRDQIVPMRVANFHVATSGGLRIQVGADQYEPTEYALGQVAARAGVPLPYLRELDAPTAAAWQHELATEILRQHYHHAPDGRVLVRSVRGQMRGWLSDRYRRLDSRPLFEALAEEAVRAGAVPVDGVVTETRVALKLVLPDILEPIPGEFLVVGGEWSNSDYGNGTHSFRMYALRVACLNGLTAEDVLRQVHLGGRLGDEIEFSDRTHALDTATSVSALRDVIRSSFASNRREALLETIREANERHVSKPALTQATRALPKTVQRTIADAFDSSDVINLPEGPTAWRASNAISWIARHTDNPETRLDLERLAGTVL